MEGSSPWLSRLPQLPQRSEWPQHCGGQSWGISPTFPLWLSVFFWVWVLVGCLPGESWASELLWQKKTEGKERGEKLIPQSHSGVLRRHMCWWHIIHTLLIWASLWFVMIFAFWGEKVFILETFPTNFFSHNIIWLLGVNTTPDLSV